MIFPEEILKHKKFVSAGLLFDFTENHDVTFVDFLEDKPGVFGSLDQRYHHVKKTHPDVNYVVLCGQSDEITYRGMWDGLPGLLQWTDPLMLGKFLYELMIVRNKCKYSFALSDCAGAFAATFATKYMPFNSVLFTTPVIGMIPNDNSFLQSFEERHEDKKTFIKKHGSIPGIENRCVIYDKGQRYKDYFDAFPYLLDYIKTGSKLEIHWATSVTGVDKFEKDRISKITGLNITIKEHVIPENIHAHLLNGYLFKTGELKTMIRKEIEYGKKYIETLEK